MFVLYMYTVFTYYLYLLVICHECMCFMLIIYNHYVCI